MSTPLFDRFHFLARDGQHAKTPIRAEVPSVKTDQGVATLRLYDPLDSYGGPFGLSAKEFVGALDELPDNTTEIRLLINSPGGEVFQGIAILNALRAHPAHVVAVVEGIAASAASFIAAGADELLMMPNAEIFVHDALGLCVGDATDMQKMAEDLAHVSGNIASVYAARAGGTTESWRAVMLAETWYSADEAVSAGLADRVLTTSGGDQNATKDRFDLSIFNHVGRSKAPAPILPSASAVGSTPTQERSPAVAFSDEGTTTMRQKLGIAEDADEATILAALAEALDERTDPPAASPDVPEGHVVIPQAALADLQTNAAAGAQAAETLRVQNRESFLDANRTKFAPANRAAWAKEFDRDPVNTAKHFEAAPEIMPVGELGFDAEPTDSEDVTESAAYKNWSM
ncbi:MAG: head maturation protease, ClpP-related [Mycobacteriales bacterium]